MIVAGARISEDLVSKLSTDRAEGKIDVRINSFFGGKDDCATAVDSHQTNLRLALGFELRSLEFLRSVRMMP